MSFLSVSTPVAQFGSITANLPPTINPGSILVLAAGQLAGTGPVPDLTAQGYVQLSASSSGKACALYLKVAIGGGSDVAPTINYGVNRNYAVMASYDGYTLTPAQTAVERVSNAVSGVFLPAATIVSNNQLIISIAQRNNATSGAHTIGSAPAGFTIRASVLPTAASAPLAVFMDWQQTTATNLILSSVSSSPADATAQNVEAQVIFLTPASPPPVPFPPTSLGGMNVQVCQ